MLVLETIILDPVAMAAKTKYDIILHNLLHSPHVCQRGSEVLSSCSLPSTQASPLLKSLISTLPWQDYLFSLYSSNYSYEVWVQRKRGWHSSSEPRFSGTPVVPFLWPTHYGILWLGSGANLPERELTQRVHLCTTLTIDYIGRKRERHIFLWTLRHCSVDHWLLIPRTSKAIN